MAWFSRFMQGRQPNAAFGPLEWRVLDVLWARGTPTSVRQLSASFPEAAYTTLLTTLERLHRKGVLGRDKQGRAFQYQPRLTRAAFEAEQAASTVQTVLSGDPAAVRPLMSFFVDAISDRDAALLDELDALVRHRRSTLGRKRS